MDIISSDMCTNLINVVHGMHEMKYVMYILRTIMLVSCSTSQISLKIVKSCY
jgi:hypothetical protein